ncbi:hypothetical protein ACFKI6_00505 [Streptococcus agalactiae]|uniref:Uncharacterized protein n=3 Tax=Streptococcus TaxID=1301 RepID=A0ACD4UI71_STRSU|nr:MULTISPECIES: hypothetical protein [Streptococcus]EJV6891438.1 hypothetical protein [Enterococcus faecalis]ESV54301.1 XRE family transcriptional regulator [Streptococcus agalactiae LMG 14747]MCI5872040.1 hypothetical protein [Streptococcus sp.]NQK94504.1 hypothetical protein [Streptococcus suis]KAF1101498.1 hypothetical protein B8U81_10430 [Streptococcus agalactiae]
MAYAYDRNYNLKTYTDVLTKARKVFEENNTNTAQAINLFLKNVAITGKIDLIAEEELEKELIFQEIQKTVKSSIKDYEEGRTVSLEKARERFGL